ncbi:MAG TPA: energy transducer TonB [Chryseolinea sp.]
MHRLLIGLPVLASLVSFGQETKRVVVETPTPLVREEYYVLVEHPEVKHGLYSRQFSKSSERGQYENNVRVGVWEFYDKDRVVEQRIDFTKHELIFAKPFRLVKQWWVLENGVQRSDSTGTPPVLIGGISRWASSHPSLRYPAEARKGGIQGEVRISATITTTGEMADRKIEEGPGHGLNEEALRVARLMDGEWFPAMIDGEAKDARVIIAFYFKLAE